MDDPEPLITGHPFEPYMWDESRCGYVDGDDVMCGGSEAEHARPPSPPVHHQHLGDRGEGDSRLR